MKKLISPVIACVLSLTSCSFIPDFMNQSSTNNVSETISPVENTVTEVTSNESFVPDVSPAPPVISNADFSDLKEQYAGRIATCLQTMEKTTGSNLITANDNTSSENDPFWNAIAEKIDILDVNPVEITSAVAVLPSEVGSSSAYETGFIPFVYEPTFGNAKNYSKLSPRQILAVVAEQTFGVSSKNVNVGYSEAQNLYCTYIISDINPDYVVICALYAYPENDAITKFGVETFARSYSGTYDTDGCMSSICNMSEIPAEDLFSDSCIVSEHRRMCDIAATVMSRGYYYQRSSAKFVTVNDGSSYLDNCCHVSSAHYVSWFYLT